MMIAKTPRPAIIALVAMVAWAGTPAAAGDTARLALRAETDFFRLPEGANFGAAAAVAVNSRGHVFVYHRGADALMEFDANGEFIRSLGEGLITKAHGLHIDAEDNIWTTDTGDHVILKLSPEGRVLMVLGVKGQAGEWHATYDVLLMNQPTDVTTAPDGTIYITDGYGNSRMIKLSPDGVVLKIWGEHGDGPGQFASPHNVVVAPDGRIIMTDRDNSRIQVFDADGEFLEQWTGFKTPNGLELTPRNTLLLADSGLEQVLEIDLKGHVLGVFGGPGKASGQFGLAHGVAGSLSSAVFVSEILNWRVQRLTAGD